MYKVDFDQNKIEPLQTETFSNLGFSERNHLQEWIANHPQSLGEELLILQKEFSGFDGTKERFDLLALDQSGNLVIIENKLDDSGRDVVWQALKYASYCASLTSQEICQIYQSFLDQHTKTKKAIDQIYNFLGLETDEDLNLNRGATQRVIMIAAKFRKEVTSTVLWLMNYNIRIQCFKATPFKLKDQVLLNLEQIIPTQDTAEYVVRMAQKSSHENRVAEQNDHIALARQKFWRQLLTVMNQKSSLFQQANPSQKPYISTSAHLTGISWSFNLTHSSCRSQIYIEPGDKIYNKQIFDRLYQKKNVLEPALGFPITWERMEGKKACRIESRIQADFFDRARWNSTIEEITDRMVQLEKIFSLSLTEILP